MIYVHTCIYILQGPELLNKYIGASEQAVRDTFLRYLLVKLTGKVKTTSLCSKYKFLTIKLHNKHNML